MAALFVRIGTHVYQENLLAHQYINKYRCYPTVYKNDVHLILPQQVPTKKKCYIFLRKKMKKLCARDMCDSIC